MVLNTQNFVYCGTQLCEARLADSTLWRQYFRLGQINFNGNIATNFFYELNHLGSVIGLVNNSGSEITSISYSAFGIPTVLSGTVIPDFGYAGYYLHSRSGLNLTATRAYSSGLGRFISRDLIEESGGINLYAYVGNAPVK